MDERKWMDAILLPRRQRDDFNDEFDTITSKVAKDWLIENGYEVYNFVWDILWKITELRIASKRRPELLGKTKEYFINIFGNRLENLVEYEKAIRQLGKDAKIRQKTDYTYFGICPDFVIKKKNDIYFLDVIANQANPKKYNKTSYEIAKQCNFVTMVLKIDVEINVRDISLREY